MDHVPVDFGVYIYKITKVMQAGIIKELLRK